MRQTQTEAGRAELPSGKQEAFKSRMSSKTPKQIVLSSNMENRVQTQSPAAATQSEAPRPTFLAGRGLPPVLGNFIGSAASK